MTTGDKPIDLFAGNPTAMKEFVDTFVNSGVMLGGAMSIALTDAALAEVTRLRAEGWRIECGVSVGPIGDAGVILSLTHGTERRFLSEIAEDPSNLN